MDKTFYYITDDKYFENTSLRNPITFLDYNLEQLYPEYYKINYDLKLLVGIEPSDKEKSIFFYNDSDEEFKSHDIKMLELATQEKQSKSVLLNGFDQKHFEYIAPFIKNTIKVLYLFKCHKIHDLSLLSEFQHLKCVLIYWNNSLEKLWNMSNNPDLTVLSFISITKLNDIRTIKNSSVKYINFDSSDNSGNKKNMLFDSNIFDDMTKLRYLNLVYSNS